MHKDFSRLLMAFVLSYAPLFQFGLLCFIGQRLISASEALMDATYNCEWHQRDRSFRRTLIIIREMCMQKFEFGVLSMSFSHENFKNVNFFDFLRTNINASLKGYELHLQLLQHAD